ncbi:MAG: hypothetical protein KBS77_01670 [Bacteroidales bacterium]|nr:hypothetical protein [Candidatus Colicola faecequi]
MVQTKEKRMYMRVRNVCGLLGTILPWLALFSAGLTHHESPDWWWSISATYYQSPALVGVLVPASIVLLFYIGYDKLDNIITSLSGVFGLLIVLFPCKVSWINDGNPVGFFQVPIEISAIIHNVSAMVFFLLIAFNSVYLFTKTGGEMTPRKRIRNMIYRICGWSMVAIMVVFLVLKLLHAPGYSIMIVEILLLTLFGISWLVKGEAFPFLNDVEEAEPTK